MRCPSKTKNELMKEFLKYLISIRRIMNINIKIHSLATELALNYIKRKIKRNRETIVSIEFHPGPIPGKDIFIKTNKGTHYAEVLCNDSFKEEEQFKKLREDIRKLKNNRATKKYLFVLSKEQKVEAERKLKNRKIALNRIEICPIL